MKIKIDGQDVRVLRADCRDNSCLVVGRYVHHSSAGASGHSSWSDKELSCITRDNHGCPPEDKQRLNPDALHHCEKPRFGSKIKQRNGARVKCYTCGKLVPRWVAYEQQRR